MLNTASGPLKNVDVRRALADATDYSGMISALQGSFVASHGIIPKGMWGYDPNLNSSTTNVTAAKRLLAQAGYGPGKRKLSLTLTYTQGDNDEQTLATLMKSEYAPLNIDLNIEPLQWATQWAKAKSSNTSSRQDILMFYWWPDYADPYSWFINLFRAATPVNYNLAYLNDPAVNSEIDHVEAMSATDRSGAIALYRKIESQLISQGAALFLGTQVYQRAYEKSVGGYVDNPAYPNVVFAYDLVPS
jgi:peptide/nickel transport system substrate-binding protein